MKKSVKESDLFDHNLLWLFEQIDSPAVCLSVDGKVIAINDKALQLFKCKQQEVLNKSFLRFLKKQGLSSNIPKNLSDMPEKIEIASEEDVNFVGLTWTHRPLTTKSNKMFCIILIASSPQLKTQFEKSFAVDEKFNMQELMNDVVILMNKYADKKNLTLTSYYPSNVPEEVIGNHNIIHRIFLSLVNNAIKYTNEGNVFITVELLGSTDEEITLKLVVRDTGVGISADKYEKIFEKKKITSSKQEMDLNLSTIKHLIDSMHGEFQIESVKNKGTTVSFVLNFKLIGSDICREEEASYQPFIEQEQIAKVLIVEDDSMCQNVMKQFLSELHYYSDVASTAQEALKLLKNHYDVILMDIGLPDQDGMSLTKDIHNKLNLWIPTIAVTGYEWDRNKYEETGFCGVVKKPVSREKLEHAIFRALARKR